MSRLIRLEIRRPDREPRIFDIEPGVYVMGRDDDCAIQLPHDAVEGRHAILDVRKPDDWWLEELDAETGTWMDGRRIAGRVGLIAGGTIRIGPYEIRIGAPDQPAVPGLTPDAATSSSTVSADPDALSARRSIKAQIHLELIKRLDIKRLTTTHIDKDELRRRAADTVAHIVREVRDRLPAGMDPDALAKEIGDEALGLGPLEEFLADPEITEIMVNGPDHVYIETHGRLVKTNRTFTDAASVLAIIERIVSPIGRRIDESQPYVDARLPDGSRVNAIIHPLSLVGPCLTIRKFSPRPFQDEDLVRLGTLTPSMAEFLRLCVRMRRNIVVSGGTGSGKTTLLNVLSHYLPSSDRILTIEDAAELQLEQEHVVRLEARPPNIEGRGAVTIRDLVRNALRMRPDRIIVGECRGGEALDMLQAMNTGHDGSLTTVHANSPRDVISRLETMVLMSGMDLPIRAIREQIASAIHLIVHEARFSDGSRKVTQVSEVVGQEGDQITMQDIFEFRQTGLNAEGKVIGDFHPTGSVPTFIEEVTARGLEIDRSMFTPSNWRRTGEKA